MKPIDFEEKNMVYGPPVNWDEKRDGQCGSLHVCVEKNATHVSVWSPTDEERHAIANGADVQLDVVCAVQPPVAVRVYGQRKLDPMQPAMPAGTVLQ